MKKLILIALLVAAFDSFGLPSIVVSFAKSGCFPGCNSTARTRTLEYYYDAHLNANVYYWAVSITCSGTGMSSCPSTVTAPLNPGDNDGISGFDLSSADFMLTHAYTEISNNNNNNSYNTNILNTTTGDLWTYYVTWQYQLHSDGSTTESYVVSRELN